MGFIRDARGEVEFAFFAAISVVAKRQSPQALDFERISLCIQHCARWTAGGDVKRVDPAVSEVAYKKPVAERAEARLPQSPIPMVNLTGQPRSVGERDSR